MDSYGPSLWYVAVTRAMRRLVVPSAFTDVENALHEVQRLVEVKRRAAAAERTAAQGGVSAAGVGAGAVVVPGAGAGAGAGALLLLPPFGDDHPAPHSRDDAQLYRANKEPAAGAYNRAQLRFCSTFSAQLFQLNFSSTLAVPESSPETAQITQITQMVLKLN